MSKLCGSIIGLVFLLWPPASYAHIPSAQLILDKVTANRGVGSYQMVLHVEWPVGARKLIVRETWTVESPESLHFKAEGVSAELKGFRREALYQNGRRYSKDPEGVVKYRELTLDQFERVFWLRSGRALMKLLVQAKAVPEAALTPVETEPGSPRPPEDFVRLTRAGGRVAFYFGARSSAEALVGPPGLWIEQDRFLVQKLRLSDGRSVSVEQQMAYEKNFSYPSLRVLHMMPPGSAGAAESAVQLRVLRLVRQNLTAGTRELLQTQSLRSAQAPTITPTAESTTALSLEPAQLTLLEEFYSRYR